MEPIALTPNIWYCGANDRHTLRFENLWTIPGGVSYNAWYIRDEQSALIDTVDAGFTQRYLHHVKQLTDTTHTPHYLIINHMEPDHSGAIMALIQHYPNLTIVGNKHTVRMLQNFYNITRQIIEITDGSTLSLGKHTLSFHLTPMLHWPEAMMTFEHHTGTLFSADVFGSYGTLNGYLLDNEATHQPLIDEMIRYYATVLGKYHKPAHRALKKLQQLPVKTIAPAHGVVWKAQKNEVLQWYQQLSSFNGEPGVTLLYGSMYGNTEQMAESIARALTKHHIPLHMHDVSRSDPSHMLAHLFRYSHVIMGAPTYNGHIYPPMHQMMQHIIHTGLQHRTVALFGNSSWGRGAVKTLETFAEDMQWHLIGSPFKAISTPTPNDFDRCRALAKTVISTLMPVMAE